MYKLGRIFNWNLNWNAMTIIFAGSFYNCLRVASLSATAHWGERDNDDLVGAI